MFTFVSLSFLFVVSQDKAKLLKGHVHEQKWILIPNSFLTLLQYWNVPSQVWVVTKQPFSCGHFHMNSISKSS